VENKIVVVADHPSFIPQAKGFSEKYELGLLESSSDLPHHEYALHFSEDGIYLSWLSSKKRLRLTIDFTGGRIAHRRKFGGGKGQLIAKAVGLQSKRRHIDVFDCTAGQGGDAFVLASLGCNVLMMERSFIAHALLESGLERAGTIANNGDEELSNVIGRLSLILGDAKEFLVSSQRQFDVIYLDPMFPARKKSALVKKEMQFFHKLIGNDDDSNSLLEIARSHAIYRVVVKRPKGAPHLNNETPTFELSGKSTRFDIYVNQSIDVVNSSS